MTIVDVVVVCQPLELVGVNWYRHIAVMDHVSRRLSLRKCFEASVMMASYFCFVHYVSLFHSFIALTT